MKAWRAGDRVVVQRGDTLLLLNGAPELIAERSPTANPELAARLEAHAKSIDADSGHQSEIDARHNAISLGSSASALAAAAKMLR